MRSCRHIRGRLGRLLDFELPESEAAAAALDRIRQRQREMQELVAGHLLFEKQIRTPEQRAAFFSELKERMQSQAHSPRWLSWRPDGRK